jgi:hypothetical protein
MATVLTSVDDLGTLIGRLSDATFRSNHRSLKSCGHVSHVGDLGIVIAESRLKRGRFVNPRSVRSTAEISLSDKGKLDGRFYD